MERGKIPELDGVRGTACLMVLLAHCALGPILSGLEPSSWQWQLGIRLLPFLLAGVDLFFVLSGFLIGGILLDNREAPNFFRAFWTRRVARIFPVAYLLVLSYGLALAVRAHFDLPQMDHFLLRNQISPWYYALFLQSIPIATHAGGPLWIGITWSLAIEEQFYLLFPFLVYFLSRRAVTLVALGAILIAPVVRAILTEQYDWFTAYVMLPGRMDALMYGVLAAIILRSRAALAIATRWRLLGDAVVLTVAFLLYSNSFDIWFDGLRLQHSALAALVRTSKYSAVAVMFMVLILRVFLYGDGLYRRALRCRVLMGVGAISYACYMYHQSINGLLHGFLFDQAPRIASWAEFGVALLAIAISVGLAVVSYFYFEMPIRQWGRRVRVARTRVAEADALAG
jgi:peptidoglycan/LPS O-acetylase OafA/YrhL